MKATGVNTHHFTLTFNENVKLSSQTDKIIVSPPQREAARITANGHHVSIILSDSLRPSTTYSFYFDDVIVDNNEDNPLENFGYLVSTGERIDSMQLAGRVIDALTFEPINGLIVGAYPEEKINDSTLRLHPFPFVSKTNKMGFFTMRGLPNSSYKVFATRDNDANYQYSDRSEGLAFSAQTYKTTLRDSMRTDTIRIDSIVRRDTLHRDSLVTYPYTYYYPQDIALRYSVAQVERRGLERHSRLDSLVCRLEFLTEPKHLPLLHSLDKPNATADALYVATAKGKVVDLWLRDPELIARDSLRFALTYEKTDSLLRIQKQTDTLVFIKPLVRGSKHSKPVEREKSPLQITLTGASGIYGGTPGDSLYLTASRPLATLPTSAIRLEVREDSIYKPQTFTLKQDSLDRLRYALLFPRAYGKSYRARIDSASLSDIYGAHCDSVILTQQIQQETELGQLSIVLQGIRSNALVQLLDKSEAVLTQVYGREIKADTTTKTQPTEKPNKEDKVLSKLLAKQASKATKRASKEVKQLSKEPKTDTLPAPQPAEEACQVTFHDLKPGEYFLRLIIDADQNAAFTPGDYPDRSPEEVYYYPQALSIKKGFTSEEKWDVHTQSPMGSKPEVLRKVKPDEGKKKREDKNVEYYKRWGRKH